MALDKNIVVLIGGVGGAKLALGLMAAAPPEGLTFIVNTGDDFWHLGLKICPDLDTLMYTLSGLVDARNGWGIADDSLAVLGSLEAHYAIEPWFRLGDKDLATHILRTHLLRQGQSLGDVAALMSRRLGISARLLPMSDDEAPTLVDTVEQGELGFQEYFVKHRWQPVVKSIRHQDCHRARLSPAVVDALAAADIVLIAPSNPWLSIAPILAVPGMRAALRALPAPKVALTPIVGGEAVKGPTAKIMRELGMGVCAKAVAEYYGDIINGFVDDIRNPTMQTRCLRMTRLDTLMTDTARKVSLARNILNWIESWAS